jgi:hypothetical protein
VVDTKGTREFQAKDGECYTSPPIPWHEFANIGVTTIQYINSREKIPAAATPCAGGSPARYAAARLSSGSPIGRRCPRTPEEILEGFFMPPPMARNERS